MRSVWLVEIPALEHLLPTLLVIRWHHSLSAEVQSPNVPMHHIENTHVRRYDDAPAYGVFSVSAHRLCRIQSDIIDVN